MPGRVFLGDRVQPAVVALAARAIVAPLLGPVCRVGRQVVPQIWKGLPIDDAPVPQPAGRGPAVAPIAPTARPLGLVAGLDSAAAVDRLGRRDHRRLGHLAEIPRQTF